MAKINASRAYKIFKELGVDITYPTVKHRVINDWGIAEQVAGTYSNILMEENDLRDCIAKYYPQTNKRRDELNARKNTSD